MPKGRIGVESSTEKHAKRFAGRVKMVSPEKVMVVRAKLEHRISEVQSRLRGLNLDIRDRGRIIGAKKPQAIKKEFENTERLIASKKNELERLERGLAAGARINQKSILSKRRAIVEMQAMLENMKKAVREISGLEARREAALKQFSRLHRMQEGLEMHQ